MSLFSIVDPFWLRSLPGSLRAQRALLIIGFALLGIACGDLVGVARSRQVWATTSGCVVIASRVPVAVPYRLEFEAGSGTSVTLTPGAVRSHRIAGPTFILLGRNDSPQRQPLEPDRAYVLVPNEAGDDVELRQIDFGAGKFDATPVMDRVRPTDQQLAAGVLAIRVVMDGREPETVAFAERRLRRRLATASELLAAAAGIRLHILSFGTWDPGAAAEDWESARRDFESRAPLESARLVVGFTRQYPVTPSEVAKSKLSEEPLTTHLLVPDAQAHFSEEQCLETLLHELGHFWGATHVSETSSPMRANLDEPAGPWPLAFDPASALAMSLVADEVRTRGISQWEELSPTRSKLIESLRARVASARAPASVAAPSPSQEVVPPKVSLRVAETVVPDVPGGAAIWSGITRDRAGRLWFAVSTELEANASASVFEFDGVRPPQFRGNVASALRTVPGTPPDEKARLILSPILEADDGHLYFSSISDSTAHPDPRQAPRWGSRLWRIRRPENTWEMLLQVPQGIATIACYGDYVYALAYPGQRLLQYHVPSGQTKSVVVESPPTHVCRTLVIDARGHLFIPSILSDPTNPSMGSAASLAEYSPQLRMLQRTPLEHYASTTRRLELPGTKESTANSRGDLEPPGVAGSDAAIAFDPGILATHRDATSTKFLTSSSALYAIRVPVARPQAGAGATPSSPRTGLPNQRPPLGPRPGQPSSAAPRTLPQSGFRPPAATGGLVRPTDSAVRSPTSPSNSSPVAQAAQIELIEVMNERPRLFSGVFHEDGSEFAVAALPLDSPTRIDLALVPLRQLQRVWTTFPNAESLKGLTFHGSAAATEGGRYWFAGDYDRGPQSLDDGVLKLLERRGLSEEQLQRLRVNSQRQRQPLLFSLEFEAEVDSK